MALRTCTSCGKQLARNAYTCPHCGKRYNTFLANLFIWLFIVPIIGGILYNAFIK